MNVIWENPLSIASDDVQRHVMPSTLVQGYERKLLIQAMAVDVYDVAMPPCP